MGAAGAFGDTPPVAAVNSTQHSHDGRSGRSALAQTRRFAFEVGVSRVRVPVQSRRIPHNRRWFTNFANYRIRALLYAGKPNWALLDTLTPT